MVAAMIINVGITITPVGFEITVIDDKGEDIRESYLRDRHGYDCHQGNFSDEPVFDDHAGLLMALGDLTESVKEVAEQLRLPKGDKHESSSN